VAAWDVLVVGAGPAGLAAAYAAARAGARVIIVEQAQHPRYKTCGGGLISPSLDALPEGFTVPVREQVVRITFTHNGQRGFSRPARSGPLVSMVLRDEFDAALLARVCEQGVEVRERSAVRALTEEPDGVRVHLATGEEFTASYVVGADGSSGRTSRYVGVAYDQVDLGLEVELPTPPTRQREWDAHLLIDWGPIPGSYGWVFPKGDRLTVGVIASRGEGERTRQYLESFVERLGLTGIAPLQDSGHLTRCRTETSPLHRGRVLVAGDAAGLLEPWTREGISFALRSGAFAGEAAAKGDPSLYVESVGRTLVPVMRTGRRLLRAYQRHPGLLHAALRSRAGWRLFERFCRTEQTYPAFAERLPARAALALLSR
jgi:geranylgeranyl reductase family protein